MVSYELKVPIAFAINLFSRFTQNTSQLIIIMLLPFCSTFALATNCSFNKAGAKKLDLYSIALTNLFSLWTPDKPATPKAPSIKADRPPCATFGVAKWSLLMVNSQLHHQK